MQKFSSNTVDIRLMPEGKAELLTDFYYENNEVKVIVKAGFIFDGASIPRFFWRIIGHPFSYKLVRAAVIHDVLYATEYFNRWFADNLFAEMLDFSGVSDLKEKVMYDAVKIAGGSVWDSHTEQGILDALKYIEVIEK